MNRDELERLLNREIDGQNSPEEEAALMDHVSRDPQAAKDQEMMHDIRRAFRGMDRPEAPEGLAGRVADAVLEGNEGGQRLSFPAPGRTWMNSAAAIVLLVLIGGVGGYLAGSHRPLHGGADTVTEARELLIERRIRDWGIDRQTALEVQEIIERFRRARNQLRDSISAPLARLDDQETVEILRLLDVAQRENYRKSQGMSEKEFERLLQETETK